MTRTIAPSELIVNSDGSVFHLHLRPEQLARTVILVGDPGRVEQVASRFDRIEHRAANREFVTAKHALMVGNDEQNDIVGARTAGIDGVYFRTEISPADDPETSSYAVRSFTGADYEGLLDYVLNA